jgi:TP901 family phage tail tape measure protein
MADINLNIGGNTSQLMRDIEKTVNRVYNINLKTKGEAPLGRITGKVNEFSKSLDASNARVIAFGASAGIIFGVQRAFSELAKATVEVQKSLQDINVILNVSSSQLQKFGGELFNIAKNTGQSFGAVAEAATEFSRQGLGVVETLKRTSEALILSRLSGLDTVKSVEALTAAVNSFASQAVTATEIVNKFANVDAAFAVSSKDLAEAISRVGSSAAQSGVSLNELIAIVTSAQQTTARGGAVIGNSFKTIFTRLQRGKVVDLLGTLGISDTNAGGELKSTIQLLQDLGKVYDTLGARQQAAVAEQVGGVFQINILKAALADLGKEYSIYNSALDVAAGSTDQAIKRNEELNKTYAAQLNALQENARQAGATVGGRVLGPAFDRVVGNANELLGGLNESDGQGVGSVLGKGILDGLGQVLAGPGLVLIGGVLFKLFKDLAGFAAQSFQQLLGLNGAATQQKDLQLSINQILQKNPQLLELALKGEQGIANAAALLLQNLRSQTAELQKQATVSAQIAKTFYASGVRLSGGVPVAPISKTPKVKSGGFIPNFFAQSELAGIKKSPDYTSSQKRKAAGDIRYDSNFPGLGPTVFNGQESVVASEQVATAMGYPAGTKPKNPAEKYSILTPAMAENLGFAAKGFVPNFATVKDIAKFNPRVKERLSFSQSPRGDGRLQNEDLINLSGRGYKQKEFAIQSGESFKKYESRVLQQSQSLLGKSYRSGEELRFVTSAAVDGYNISQVGNETSIDLLEVKGGKNWNPSSVLNKFLRAVPENYLSGNKLDVFKNKKDDITLGATLVTPFKKEKAKPTQSRLLGRGRYSGFIPNFAQALTQTKKEVVDLGDTRNSKLLGGKVLSLIYPQFSKGYSMQQGTGKYLGKTYTGKIPVAGIDKNRIKGELPDLEKNVDNLLLREANQFGQVLGGKNFLQSANDLPNRGAVKGAVGVAFEGAVKTLIEKSVGQSSQNVGIDFRTINPQLKSLFNEAPGMYDAKRSSALTNEVMQKLLNEVKPGAITQKSSGAAGKAYVAQRSAAVEQLRKEGVSGSNNIKRELKNRFGIVGKAAGFIPNFAAIQAPLQKARQDAIDRELDAGASPGQIRMGASRNLETPFNPNGDAIWSTKFESSLSEGIAMAKDAGFDPKTKGMSGASGFVPNFAEPAAPTQDVAGALGLQLASILPLLALTAQRGDEYAQSLQNITEENKKAGKVTGQLTKAQKAGIVESVKTGKLTREQGIQALREGRFGATTTQKVGARFGGGGSAAFAAATIAPILAETLKQGIDQTTKEGRKNAALTSGLGQTAAFAATGFAVGGPVGAAVGLVAGAGLTLKSVLDEINTDLPELSAAAQQASEALTKFNDQSQRILTGFEQVKQLREGGQASRAGEIEAQLLRDVSVDFAESPDLALKATTAILNKDFKSLTEALNANSEILIKQQQEKSREESITKSIETLGKEGIGGKVGQEAAKSLGLDFFKRVDVTQGPVGTGNIENLVKEFQKFEDYTGGAPVSPFQITAERVTKEDLIESIRASGLDEASQGVLEKLIKEQNSVEGAIAALEEFKKNIENGNSIQESIANNTSKNNKVIQLIQAALSKVASNFNKLASLSSETLAIQSTFNQAKQEALSAIQVEDLSGRAEVAETFGGQEQSRRLGIEAERAGISGTFDKEVGTALANVTDLIGQSLNQGISQGFKEIGSFGTGSEEDKAKQQLAEAQRLSGAVSPESILQEVAGILNADQFKQGTGVLDTNAITEALQQSQNFAKLSPEDQTKTLEKLREEINKSNQVLQKSLVVQQQQLTIAANQRLNQIIKELATAVINSFGGIEKFITGKALDDTIADDIKEILAERESIRNAVGGGTPDRDSMTEYGRRAGRLLDAFTEVTGGRGGIFTEDTGLVQQEIRGQANNIEDIYNAIRDASMDPNASKSEQEAFEKTRQALIEQSGVQVGPGGNMRPVFEEIARIQSLERRKSGEISTGIRDNAVKKLAESDPALAELLKFDKEGNLISGGALDSADLSLKFESQQVDLLRDILNALEQTGERVEVAEQAQTLQELEDAIIAPAAQAGIQLPGTEGITDAIFNNVPSLYDPNAPVNVQPSGPFEQPLSLIDPRTAFGEDADAVAPYSSPDVIASSDALRAPIEWTGGPSELPTESNPYNRLLERGLMDRNPLAYNPRFDEDRSLEDARTGLTLSDLQNSPGYNITPGLGVGINPTNETFEETSQLRDSIQEEVSAVNNLTTSISTLSEQLGRGNAEAGSNQNLAGGTFGDITVSPAAINVTVEGSLEQDKIAEIERVLREQSDQNITQVIADLQASVSRQQETLNNITAQNPGVRPPPRGPVGAR